MSLTIEATVRRNLLNYKNIQFKTNTEIIDQVYTEDVKGFLTVPSDNVYYDLSFNNVGTAYYLSIVSDQILSFQLNGSSTTINGRSILIKGLATALKYKNNSGKTANIKFYIYGV